MIRRLIVVLAAIALFPVFMVWVIPGALIGVVAWLILGSEDAFMYSFGWPVLIWIEVAERLEVLE